VNRAEALQAAAILALLVVLEGVRRLAPDTLVMRRTMWRRWTVARATRLGAGFHVVSWLVPLALPVLLSPASGGSGEGSPGESDLASMRAREAAVHLDVRVLQLNGIVIAAMLVIGVPYLTWSRGLFGLVIALLQLLFATMLQAMVAHDALARIGAPAALRRWISPFAAIRAAEAVQEGIVAGVPRLLAIRELLGEEALLRSYRSELHDLARGDQQGSDARALAMLLGMERIRSFLDDRPSDLGDEGFCPRCASRYRAGVAECAGCELPLARGAA
jgi:hypothetical protein